MRLKLRLMKLRILLRQKRSADVEEDEAAASYEDEDFSEFAEFGSTDEYEQLAEEDTNEDA